MSSKDLDELLGAYALDAVDDDERAELDDYVAANPRARAEVEGYREVASLLAFTGAPAPEGIWDRIAAAIDDSAPDTSVLPFELPMPPGAPVGAPAADHDAPVAPVITMTSVRAGRARRWGRATLAAAAAVVIVALGATALRLDNRVEELEASGDPSVTELATAALADPANRTVELVSTDGSAKVEVALADDGTGYLVVDELPALADDQTYQLWGVNGDEVFSLGLLGSSPDAAAFPAVGGLDALAITAEVAGGVAVSDHAPVVSGAVA